MPALIRSHPESRRGRIVIGMRVTSSHQDVRARCLKHAGRSARRTKQSGGSYNPESLTAHFDVPPSIDCSAASTTLQAQGVEFWWSCLCFWPTTKGPRTNKDEQSWSVSVDVPTVLMTPLWDDLTRERLMLPDRTSASMTDFPSHMTPSPRLIAWSNESTCSLPLWNGSSQTSSWLPLPRPSIYRLPLLS